MHFLFYSFPFLSLVETDGRWMAKKKFTHQKWKEASKEWMYLVFLQPLLLLFNTQKASAFTVHNRPPHRPTKLIIKMSVDNNEKYLTPISADQVKLEIKDPVDPTALSQAKDIIKELRSSSDDTSPNGTVNPAQLMQVAKRLGDIPQEVNSYVATKEECKAAFDALNDVERRSLVNIHARVLAFATAQRMSVQDMEIDIPGGKAGHTVSPCSGECLLRSPIIHNTTFHIELMY